MTTICFLDKKTVILSCHLTQISLTCQKTFLSLFWLLKKRFSLLKFICVPAPCTSLEHPSLYSRAQQTAFILPSLPGPLRGLGAGPCQPFPFLGATILFLSKTCTQPREQQPRQGNTQPFPMLPSLYMCKLTWHLLQTQNSATHKQIGYTCIQLEKHTKLWLIGSILLG